MTSYSELVEAIKPLEKFGLPEDDPDGTWVIAPGPTRAERHGARVTLFKLAMHLLAVGMLVWLIAEV